MTSTEKGEFLVQDEGESCKFSITKLNVNTGKVRKP